VTSGIWNVTSGIRYATSGIQGHRTKTGRVVFVSCKPKHKNEQSRVYEIIATQSITDTKTGRVEFCHQGQNHRKKQHIASKPHHPPTSSGLGRGCKAVAFTRRLRRRQLKVLLGTPSPASRRTWNFQAQDPAALPARLSVGRIGHRRHQNRLRSE